MALGASYIYHRHVPGTKDIAEMRTNMELISRAMAQQIVDTVKDVCSQNINFIDEKGIIVASTDRDRVGTYHEVGYRVVLEGNTIEVTDDNSFRGTRKGINIPITYNGRIIAVIGISGEVEEVRISGTEDHGHPVKRERTGCAGSSEEEPPELRDPLSAEPGTAGGSLPEGYVTRKRSDGKICLPCGSGATEFQIQSEQPVYDPVGYYTDVCPDAGGILPIQLPE